MAREVTSKAALEALASQGRAAATRRAAVALFLAKKRRAMARWKVGTHRVQYQLLGATSGVRWASHRRDARFAGEVRQAELHRARAERRALQRRYRALVWRGAVLRLARTRLTRWVAAWRRAARELSACDHGIALRSRELKVEAACSLSVPRLGATLTKAGRGHRAPRCRFLCATSSRSALAAARGAMARVLLGWRRVAAQRSIAAVSARLGAVAIVRLLGDAATQRVARAWVTWARAIAASRAAEASMVRALGRLRHVCLAASWATWRGAVRYACVRASSLGAAVRVSSPGVRTPARSPRAVRFSPSRLCYCAGGAAPPLPRGSLSRLLSVARCPSHVPSRGSRRGAAREQTRSFTASARCARGHKRSPGRPLCAAQIPPGTHPQACGTLTGGYDGFLGGKRHAYCRPGVRPHAPRGQIASPRRVSQRCCCALLWAHGALPSSAGAHASTRTKPSRSSRQQQTRKPRWVFNLQS